MKKRFDTFSVPLGLLDYVNPILYTLTMTTILRNEYALMGRPYNTFFLVGAAISILFGFVIPTGKVIVGLGIIEFVMPVSLVFCVNSGILISGLMLFRHVLGLGSIALGVLASLIVCLLVLLYRKSKKLNTIAVLTGAAGYLLLYVSLITMSIRKAILLPIILYALAIMLFVMLCGIGIKGNLKDPKVHWVIEASNVMCQLFVAIATILLYAS